MRARILEATIDCLVTYGYAGTSTARIADCAGVTRGALLHHFRAKEDLVVAAVEYLAGQRAELVLRQLSHLRGNPASVQTALDFLWEAHQGPMFAATTELWVAARTDLTLAEQVRRVEPLVNDTLMSAIAQLLPDRAAQKNLRNAVFTAMDVLRGILTTSFADADMTRARSRWERAGVDLRGALSSNLPEVNLA